MAARPWSLPFSSVSSRGGSLVRLGGCATNVTPPGMVRFASTESPADVSSQTRFTGPHSSSK